MLRALVVAIADVAWIVRVVRSQDVPIREVDFVKAAASLGLSHTRIVARHILRNGIDSVDAPTAAAAADRQEIFPSTSRDLDA